VTSVVLYAGAGSCLQVRDQVSCHQLRH